MSFAVRLFASPCLVLLCVCDAHCLWLQYTIPKSQSVNECAQMQWYENMQLRQKATITNETIPHTKRWRKYHFVCFAFLCSFFRSVGLLFMFYSVFLDRIIFGICLFIIRNMSNGLLLSFSAIIYKPNVLFLPTFFRYSQPVKNEINMNHFD